MRVQVDAVRCTGHAMCAATAPDVYELDELGCNASDGATVEPGMEDAARRGAMACPEQAIELVEDDER